MKPIAEKKKAHAPLALAKKIVSAPARQQKKKTTAAAKAHQANGGKPALHENHPHAPVFGAFNDEPLWEDVMKAVKKHREEDKKFFKE
ncbi:MAG: hypothetical protein HY231_15070 [Acidobacteria bacterium]|nr:hypothetical protein [Acidobacteriota bacterium]